MTHIHFSISNWRAVGRKIANREQWQLWAEGADLHDFADYQPQLPFLSAMQKRRLSLSARLLMDAAWPLLAEDEHCPVVFVSHDGEINRSFQLWQSLLKENAVSPTSFGLSVHNAQVGQWSMLRKDMSESTALCAQEDGFETAFLEAFLMLNEGAEKVLIVVADEPLDACYPVSACRAPFAYAAAFLVERGNDWTLSLLGKKNPVALEHKQYWGALHWIRQYYLSNHQHKPIVFRQPYAIRQWFWEQNC